MRTISVKLFWVWTCGTGDFIWRYFLSRALLTHFSTEQKHLCNLGEGIMRNMYLWNYFQFGPVVQEKTAFKDISHLELWRPCIKPSKTFRALLVEAITRNNSVKLFWILTSGSGGNVIKTFLISFVQWSGTICANLVKGTTGKNSVIWNYF